MVRFISSVFFVCALAVLIGCSPKPKPKDDDKKPKADDAAAKATKEFQDKIDGTYSKDKLAFVFKKSDTTWEYKDGDKVLGKGTYKATEATKIEFTFKDKLSEDDAKALKAALGDDAKKDATSVTIAASIDGKKLKIGSTEYEQK